MSIDELSRTPSRFELLQALALLEGDVVERGAAPLGEGVGPSDEQIELRTSAGFGFRGHSLITVRSQAQLNQQPLPSELELLGRPRDRVAWRVGVATGGLLGFEGPLPQGFAEELLDLRSDGPRAFLDIFAARVLAILYRARKSIRPTLGYAPSRRDSMSPFVLAFAGAIPARRRPRSERPSARTGDSVGSLGIHLRYAGLMLESEPSVAGLAGLLDDLIDRFVLAGEFQRPWRKARFVEDEGVLRLEPIGRSPGRRVRIKVAAAPRWTAIDRDMVTRIGPGGSNNRLGRGATLGKRFCDALGGVEVRIEHRSWSSFAAMLWPGPGDPGPSFEVMARAAATYVGRRDVVSYELRVPACEVPSGVLCARARLGSSTGLVLGRAAWLGVPDGRRGCAAVRISSTCGGGGRA